MPEMEDNLQTRWRISIWTLYLGELFCLCYVLICCRVFGRETVSLSLSGSSLFGCTLWGHFCSRKPKQNRANSSTLTSCALSCQCWTGATLFEFYWRKWLLIGWNFHSTASGKVEEGRERERERVGQELIQPERAGQACRLRDLARLGHSKWLPKKQISGMKRNWLSPASCRLLDELSSGLLASENLLSASSRRSGLARSPPREENSARVKHSLFVRANSQEGFREAAGRAHRLNWIF